MRAIVTLLVELTLVALAFAAVPHLVAAGIHRLARRSARRVGVPSLRITLGVVALAQLAFLVGAWWGFWDVIASHDRPVPFDRMYPGVDPVLLGMGPSLDPAFIHGAITGLVWAAAVLVSSGAIFLFGMRGRVGGRTQHE